MTGEEVRRKVDPDDAHEGICGRAPERDIHDPSKRKGRETPRQAARVERLLSALRIDAPDFASRRLRHVEVASGAHGTARAGAPRQRREQLRIARLSGRWCAARGDWRDRRHEGNDEDQQLELKTHLPSLPHQAATAAGSGRTTTVSATLMISSGSDAAPAWRPIASGLEAW